MKDVADFALTVTGIKQDVDGAYGAQCVDLARRWVEAKDIKPGDLVIWGGGKFGHVAIAVRMGRETFLSCNQNYPPELSPRIIRHDWKNVIGGLRYQGDSGGRTDFSALHTDY
ncbi:MAG: hypothetical protein MdMp014T_1144 [Treponematales bacterium]